MAINRNLLIAAPMLQDYLVDKDTGAPLAAGTITMYKDTSRQILKDWYYQVNVGTAAKPNYNYITLPNPMTLSAVGTIADANGNDVIPFYYPYNDQDPPKPESYYVVVKNSNGEEQFTRDNFPYNPIESGTVTGIDSNQNLVVNSNFWRNVSPGAAVNIGSGSTFLTNTMSINGISYFYGVLAPSQHDSFAFPDIRFLKNTVDGTETLQFKYFSSDFEEQVLVGDPTPEFYLNIIGDADSAATAKYILIPLSAHVRSLCSYTNGTMTFQAMNLTPGTEAVISVGILQYLGTGPTSPAVVEEAVSLTADWYKNEINLSFPSITTDPGEGGDDGYYLRIALPTVQDFNINIALPSFYLSKTTPTNSYQTYDQINSIISSPRTGDYRSSLNSFQPYGWVISNDKSIGSASSGAMCRANSDTWPLYNLIYTSVSNTFAPVSGGRTSPGNTTAAAYADFIANKPMFLTKALGRILMAIPTASTFTYASSGVCTVATGDSSIYYFGAPVVLSGLTATPFVAGTIYYMIPLSTTTFSLATSPANAIARTAITGGSNGNGTMNFSLGGTFGENIHTPTEVEMFRHHHTPLNGVGAFDIRVNSGGDSNYVAGTQNRSDVQTADTGGSLAFNIAQPASYINVFLKL